MDRRGLPPLLQPSRAGATATDARAAATAPAGHQGSRPRSIRLQARGLRVRELRPAPAHFCAGRSLVGGPNPGDEVGRIGAALVLHGLIVRTAQGPPWQRLAV